MLKGSSEDAFARSTLTSGLVALFAETLLFGAFAILYGICTWMLLYRNRSLGRSKRDCILFTGSTLMFILAFVHVALDVSVTLTSFVYKAGNITDMSQSLDCLNSLADSIGAAKFGIYVTQTLIGDGLMIYRAYVVWNRNWKVASLLGVLLGGEVVFGYYISFSGPILMTTMVGSSCVDALVNAFFLISVATNLLSTALIMRRILWSDIAIQGGGAVNDSPVRSVRWRVVESILQSAAIYSIASISLAVTSFASPIIGFPACHSVFPSVIGIVFLLIVIRMVNNSSPSTPVEVSRRSNVQVSQVSSGCSQSPASGIPVLMSPRDSEPQSPSSMRSLPIAIHVSVSTTSDGVSVSSMEKGDGSISSEKFLNDITTPVDHGDTLVVYDSLC